MAKMAETVEMLRNNIPFIINPTHKAFLHCLVCTGVAVQL